MIRTWVMRCFTASYTNSYCSSAMMTIILGLSAKTFWVNADTAKRLYVSLLKFPNIFM